MSVRARWPEGALLVIAAALRLWAAWFDHGVYWPDEIYQTLEQAHRLAFGAGFVPWEYQDGARPWLLPALIAAAWRVLSGAGVTDSLVLVSVAKSAVALLSVAGIWAAMRLAEIHGGRRASLITGALLAVFPLSLMLGARVANDTVTASLNVIAALLVAPHGSTARHRAGGAVAALSVFLRNQNGLVALALLIALLATRRWNDAKQYAIGACVALLGAGLFDWVTWGRPFQSFLAYLRFQLIIAPGLSGAQSPWWAHLYALWTSTGVAVVLTAAGVLLAARRVPALVLLTLGYLAVHSAIPQKEFRFLMPIVPLALAVAGIGLAHALEHIAERWRNPVAIALVVPAALAMAWTSKHTTFGDHGLYWGTHLERLSPWHHEEDINRLLADAGRREDLCGLMTVAGTNIVQNGGYTYLHRDVPIVGLWNKPEQRFGEVASGMANYLMAASADAAPPGYERVASRGDFVLHRRDGPCVLRPSLDRRLFRRPY